MIFIFYLLSIIYIIIKLIHDYKKNKHIIIYIML